METPPKPRPSRRKRPIPRELPGEIKIVMGFLVLYGVLSLVYLLQVANVVIPEGVFSPLLIPAGLLALNVALFLGLLFRTTWGWWAATVTFGLFAAYFAFVMIESLIPFVGEALWRIKTVGRIGVMAAVVFIGLYAVPFWLLISTRRRYMASRPRKPRDSSASGRPGKDTPPPSPQAPPSPDRGTPGSA